MARRTVVAIGLLGGALGLASGCVVDVNHGNTVYSCAESQLCPDDLQCVNDVCVGEPGIDAGSAIDAGGEVDAALVPLVGGDLLFYNFDDEGSPSLIRDRSGRGLDAQRSRAVLVDGRFGKAREFSDVEDNNELRLPDNPALFAGNVLTIEAYVNRDVGQQRAVIYGDENPEDVTDSVEYALSIDVADKIEFKTNGGCGTAAVAFTSDGAVALGDWHHLAVAWDGSTIRFYIDGALSGERAHSTMPCESPEIRAYRVGRLSNDADELNGVVDELKLSSVAKSAVDIQASMNHDSAALDVGRCGDQILEDEACMAAQACCTSSCGFEDLGTACGDGATCNAAGTCLVGDGRTAEGLVALYKFDEGAGLVVGDTSGVDPALDLAIDTAASVVWAPGTLQITAPVIIASVGNALKVETAVEASSEVSVEAWVAPANTTQGGPARIVTMSPDTGSRNVTLGQEGDLFLTRFRSAAARDGLPTVASPAAEVTTDQLTHLVMTRSADGERRLYVDGALRSRNVVSGSLANWSAYPLGIANEAIGTRLWLGTFHLVAVYGRALTESEVAANFTAGAD